MSENKKLDLEWVSDVIKQEYKKWKPKDNIIINAQTGTGKTYFIKNKLIPYTNKENKNVLVLCNRVTLKRQFKVDEFNYFNIPIPKTNYDLDKVAKIGNVTILSYQLYAELLNSNEEIDINKFDYIVCDECHFLLSDASFNNRCYYIYSLLMSKCNAIKIFISATIDEIRKSVEVNNIGTLWNYTTGTDYSYVNVNLYKKDIDIITKIKNSNDKWLIFVSSKTNGNRMKKELEKYKSCEFIYGNNKNNKELDNIINNCRFNCDVLITTKVLDNGINIKDKNLHNIVIDCWDKTTFIQELGRIRVDINNPQQINLYIPTKCGKAFKTKIRKYEDIEKKIKTLQSNYNEFQIKFHNDYNKLDKTIFMLNKENKWSINLIGYARFLRDYDFLKYVIDLFGEKENYYSMAYADIQMYWIGHTKANNILEKVEEKNMVEEYLEKHLGIALDKEKQKELINLLNIRDSIGRLQKSISIVNAYLIENYNISCISKRITIDNKKKTYWILGNIK